MNTLLEYAQSNFPGQEAEVWDAGDTTQLTLTSHTVVAQVIGMEDAAEVATTMQQCVGEHSVAAVVIRAAEPSVLPDGDEDTNGLVDLPNRRVAVAAGLGVVVGAAFGLGLGLLVSTLAAAIIIAFFGAAVGGVVGAVAGGGARHASERAISQPHAPGRTVAIVAAFLHDEADAGRLARTITDGGQQYDLRIVGVDGAWHVPS